MLSDYGALTESTERSYLDAQQRQQLKRNWNQTLSNKGIQTDTNSCGQN